MSDTPRTDAQPKHGGYEKELVLADFARQLERELIAAKAALVEAKIVMHSQGEIEEQAKNMAKAVAIGFGVGPMIRRVMVCGVDCHPGDGICNNYCNMVPGKPMADEPPKGPDA